MSIKEILIFLFLSISLPFNLLGQSGKIGISVYHDIYDESTCFQLTVSNKTDTLYSRAISDEEEIGIDSLSVGRYLVTITNCGHESDEVIQSTTQIVAVKPFQITFVDFFLTQHVRYLDVDTVTSLEIVNLRAETEIEVSYFDSKWNPNSNNPKSNFGLGISGYQWNSFSKHFGFLMGGGAGFMFAPLRVDSASNGIYNEEVKSNYYSYVNARLDAKFRFSSINQQSLSIKSHGIFLDIGARYNFPIYFKKVTRFNFRDKTVNSFIHQYTDMRVYANIGVANFQFFVSYRPFDFIRGNYQELPKYNTGVKINVNYL